MPGLKKVLAICGSTRARSSNLLLIEAVSRMAEAVFEIKLFSSIDKIPHFNPDLDHDHPPAEVVQFRNQIKESDGVLICTPEYAMGVPGTLKNALDWVVSTMEFSNKPVGLITASLSGEKGHIALMETLKVIESKITPETELVIPFIKTKINEQEGIIHPATIAQVERFIKAFSAIINE